MAGRAASIAFVCDERYEPAFFAPVSAPGQRSSIDVAPDGLGLDGTADGRVSGFHTGDLEPGVYRIEAVVRARGTVSGLFFDLAFQVRDTAHPIPEPAALGTLGIGLAWLGFRARGRTPHARGRRS